MQQIILDGWDPTPADNSPTESNDFDALLLRVAAECRLAKLPISDKICPHVSVNRRARTRFGCCKKQGELFVIELSYMLLNAPEHSCRLILAHELLHTCHGCRDHGARWRSYARRMGEAFGYDISRADSHENLGIADFPPPKYIVACTKCGAEYGRIRASQLVSHPDRYRCRCGGALQTKK
jgi:predicted SprT family Zn-dependent metalloprotease